MEPTDTGAVTFALRAARGGLSASEISTRRPNNRAFPAATALASLQDLLVVSPSLPLTLSLFLSLSGFHLTRTYALTLSILISRVGCDGVPNSGKTNDECGVCDGDGSSCSGWSRVCLHARVYACGLHYRCIVFHVCTRASVRVIGCAFVCVKV